jgi:hypothetical protein
MTAQIQQGCFDGQLIGLPLLRIQRVKVAPGWHPLPEEGTCAEVRLLAC